jgi:hypothetical protein
MIRYTIEAKIDDEWYDAFCWQPLFDTKQLAQDDLNEWLAGMAMQTGMDTNVLNYRIIEVLK